MKKEPPFNPLDKRNLGVSVADALLTCTVQPLPPDESFIGAGIYAIYYVGDFKPYELIARYNRHDQYTRPIYVGKAVPPGARKGLEFGLDTDPGAVLCKRLAEHARSIDQVPNLELADFFCRYLVVDDIWIPLGESLLIDWFSPVWNKVIDGFGNHAPGGGRHLQQRSLWDMLHPGRPWADKLPPNSRNADEVIRSLLLFMATSRL